MVVTPMFPLGSVLVPGMVLPLRVFEPRYLQLLDDCRAGDQSFGVVLIERGSEVGGGDVRTDVGTLARIVRAEESPDGLWAVVAVGIRRIRVERWLTDDPYPRADCTDWPDVPGDAADPPAEITVLLRRSITLARALGRSAAPPDLELVEDPGIAGYQAIAAAPLGPADRQRLLAAATITDRWALLTTLLSEQIDLLAAQLDS